MLGAQRLRTVAVGLSGGVDSATAAHLLKAQGHDVVGVFMRNWDEPEERGSACGYEADRRSAIAVCSRLGIGFEEVDLTRNYWHDVFEPFLRKYAAGLTPNPDLECNRAVKFGPFVDWCLSKGADVVATGHYARTVRDAEGVVRLLRAGRERRDQSYFLSTLSAQQLSRVAFPLGDWTKGEVRAYAAEHGLPPADRKTSTSICFIGKRDFSQFMAQYVDPVPGRFVDVDSGRTVAPCRDVLALTVGQGASIPGQASRWYVAGKDVPSNVVWVCPSARHWSLQASGCLLGGLSWINEGPENEAATSCQVRYLTPDVPCRVTAPGAQGTRPWLHVPRQGTDTDAGTAAVVHFHSPVAAVAPGQAAVLHRGDHCLGAGEIVAPLIDLPPPSPLFDTAD